MNFEYTPFSIPYIVSGITAVVVALIAWNHRRKKAAKVLFYLMLAAGWWSFGNAMEMCSVGLAAKIWWANMEYAGIATVPSAWFATALGLTGASEWLNRRNTLLLLAVPAITQVLVWTDAYHGMVRHGFWLDTSGPFAVVVKAYGPWFWVMTAYTYVLLTIGTIRVIRAIVELPGPYRVRAALIGAAGLAPWAANVLYISGMSPIPRLDMTPIAFAVTGLAGAVAVFRYHLLDIAPITWATVVRGMDDGVVATDYRGRVAAMNPAAEALTGWSARHAVGKHAADVMRRWPEVARDLTDAVGSASGSVTEIDGQNACHEFRLQPLLSHDKASVGRLIVIRDVTERRRAHDAAMRQQRDLAAMEEREALARDMHDDVCQVLGYLNLQLQSAQGRLARGEATAAVSDINNLIGVVREAQSGVRSYIRSMRGEPESAWGLMPRLQELLHTIESRYGIRTTLTMCSELSTEAVGHARELQLFRIIQEACANAAKHAGASRLWVSLECHSSVVEVVVSDDGKGFNVVNEVLDVEGGLGLSIMRERATRLGGDFVLRSAPGRGTEVKVCIPLRPDGGGPQSEGVDR